MSTSGQNFVVQFSFSAQLAAFQQIIRTIMSGMQRVTRQTRQLNTGMINMRRTATIAVSSIGAMTYALTKLAQASMAPVENMRGFSLATGVAIKEVGALQRALRMQGLGKAAQATQAALADISMAVAVRDVTKISTWLRRSVGDADILRYRLHPEQLLAETISVAQELEAKEKGTGGAFLGRAGFSPLLLQIDAEQFLEQFSQQVDVLGDHAEKATKSMQEFNKAWGEFTNNLEMMGILFTEKVLPVITTTLKSVNAITSPLSSPDITSGRGGSFFLSEYNLPRENRSYVQIGKVDVIVNSPEDVGKAVTSLQDELGFMQSQQSQ